MLTKMRAAIVVGAVLLGNVSVAPLAAADAECIKYGLRGECLVWVTLPPGPPPPAEPPTPGQPVINPPGVTGPTDVEPVIVDGKPCYPIGRAKPQPPKDDPVWLGHEDGAIYTCDAGFMAGPQSAHLILGYWAATPPQAPPPPDPRDLAQSAVQAMQLQPITIGVVPEPKPGSIGLVGLPNYMWVKEPTADTYGPITRTAAAGGYTVTATARVERVVWDMGDGPSITCGTGTPYEPRFGKAKSPTCGHVYTRQGRYPVTATSYWVIDWAGIGQAGTITLDLTQRTTLTIGEAQVISQ